MNWKPTGIIISISGLTVLIISILVLKDGIQHQNAKWEVHNAPYHRNGYSEFWDSFKFDEDILIIISSLSILVGITQLFLPLIFACLKHNDFNRNLQLWIGTNLILALVATACFALSVIYKITSIGTKSIDHYRQRTFVLDPFTYDKGLAYVIIIFCDMIVLFLTTMLMARWSCRLSNRERHSQNHLY